MPCCVLTDFSFLFLKGGDTIFLCLTNQIISCGSQSSRECVFLVIKVLCWVISREAGLQHRVERCINRHTLSHTHIRTHTRTHTWHTHTLWISVGGSPLTSARGLALQMIKASSDREKHACAQMQKQTYTKMKMKSAQWCCNTPVCTHTHTHTQANKQLLISFQEKAGPQKKKKSLTHSDSGRTCRLVTQRDHWYSATNCKNTLSSTFDNRLTF